MTGLMTVDDEVYTWLGDPGETLPASKHANLTDVQITPTRTILSFTVGPVDLTVTFLSPIEVPSKFSWHTMCRLIYSRWSIQFCSHYHFLTWH